MQTIHLFLGLFLLITSHITHHDAEETYMNTEKTSATSNNAVHPDPPLVDAIQNFCYDAANPVTVRMLQVLTNPNNYELNWYETATGGLPLSLDEPLEHLKLYYAEFTDNNHIGGPESSIRTETKAYISNPEITSEKEAICSGESVTITVNGIPETPEDFIRDHPELTLFLNDPDTNTAYFLKEESMPWTTAYNLIQSYNTSASMYVINSQEEEDKVYNRLFALGYAGNAQYHFWLGLRQYPELNPTNSLSGGWYWLDGRPLTPALANWNTGEPNDCCTPTENGEEDYGQFDFFANKVWNDMTNNSIADGNSWPVFEFNGTTSVTWGAYTDDTLTDVIYFDEKSSSLTVTPTETTTYFVESVTNGVVCRAEYTQIVNPLPVSNPVANLELCDDATDGDDANGIIQSIDLEVQSAGILGPLQNSDDYTVTYHLTQDDAEDVTVNGLISPYTNVLNSDGSNQTIYVRVANNDTGCIDTSTSFDLIIHPLPVIEDIPDLITCDNATIGTDTDGFIRDFDLESQTAFVLGGQDPSLFTVTYHLSLADANNLLRPGLTSPFQNTQQGSQTIYVRVQNNQTKCFKTGKSFDAVVAPLPILKTNLINFEQCDDDETNDGISLFNLTTWENLFSDNYENETFEFYTSPTFEAASLIADPINFNNTAFQQSIYIRVLSQDNCFRTAQLNLKVGASSIDPSFMRRFALCEDSPADAQDGIVTFDKSVVQSIANDVIASDPKFNAQNVELNLYRTKEDALTGINPIDLTEDFTNTNPWEQPIWAFILNKDILSQECIGFKQVGTLYVEPKPIANPVNISRQCDGNSFVDEDPQDGMFPFVTSGIEAQLFEDQAGVVAYYYDENDNFLGNTLPNPFLTASQTITVNVELASTLSDVVQLDGNCYDTTTLEFIVDDAPEIFPVTIPAQCDDGVDDADGFSEFDTSAIEATLLGGQTNMVVRYFDENDVALSSPLPNPFNTQTQTITAVVENPLNPNCSISVDIDFEVNPLPTFDVTSEQILCLNIGSENIGATSFQDEYSYAWIYINNDGVETPLTETTSTIWADQPGEYLITATTTDGTNCSRTRRITLTASDIADISLEELTTLDLTDDNNNSLSIDASNLGAGDYEFAVDLPFGPFQDETLFENLRPGIHTLYIRDKNFCGTVQIDFSIVGYDKYFTPNGDGYNDRWKILGLSSQFQPNSEVYLFDRFGKLLGTIDPLGEGWDGTLNGNPMPATDYWFRVYLEDGREFKGHFSLIRGW